MLGTRTGRFSCSEADWRAGRTQGAPGEPGYTFTILFLLPLQLTPSLSLPIPSPITPFYLSYFPHLSTTQHFLPLCPISLKCLFHFSPPSLPFPCPHPSHLSPPFHQLSTHLLSTFSPPSLLFFLLFFSLLPYDLTISPFHFLSSSPLLYPPPVLFSHFPPLLSFIILLISLLLHSTEVSPS